MHCCYRPVPTLSEKHNHIVSSYEDPPQKIYIQILYCPPGNYFFCNHFGSSLNSNENTVCPITIQYNYHNIYLGSVRSCKRIVLRFEGAPPLLYTVYCCITHSPRAIYNVMRPCNIRRIYPIFLGKQEEGNNAAASSDKHLLIAHRLR